MSLNREQELQHRNDELLIKLSQCKSTIEQQAANIAKLESVLLATRSVLREYAARNPKHYCREVLQDPNGVHAALGQVEQLTQESKS